MGDGRSSKDESSLNNTQAVAAQDHATSAGAERPSTHSNREGTSNSEKPPEKGPLQRSDTANTVSTYDGDASHDNAVTPGAEDDDDDDDPIRTAAPPEMLSAPGDACVT